MEKQYSLVVCFVMALAGCAVKTSTIPLHVGPTITLHAGQSVILKTGQQALVPSGVTVSSGNGEFKITGHGGTSEGHTAVTVSVPIDAKGPADNLIIVSSVPPRDSATAPNAFGLDRWLPVSPRFQPNWREIQRSHYIDLGDDEAAVARLARSYYVQDVPEVSSSKPLACEFGYKKYLIRSFSARNDTFSGSHEYANVYETPDGLVTQVSAIVRPGDFYQGAIAICLKGPPGHIQGTATVIFLPQ